MKKPFKRFLGKGWGGNFWVKHVFSKAVVFAFSPITTPFGTKLHLDYSDGIDHIFKDYRGAEMRLCAKNIKEGDNILDIGANIGLFATCMSKIATKGKIFSFEAAPKSCRLISKNIKANNCQNIILENKAVSDRSGKVKLYLWPETKYNKLFGDESHQKYIEVESVAIDDYFKGGNRKIDFAKIDVVGSEALAVKGMKSVIKSNPEMKIFMEFSPEKIEKTGCSPSELLSFLKAEGFNIFLFNLEKEALSRVEDYNELLKNKGTKYLFFAKNRK